MGDRSVMTLALWIAVTKSGFFGFHQGPGETRGHPKPGGSSTGHQEDVRVGKSVWGTTVPPVGDIVVRRREFPAGWGQERLVGIGAPERRVLPPPPDETCRWTKLGRQLGDPEAESRQRRRGQRWMTCLWLRNNISEDNTSGVGLQAVVVFAREPTLSPQDARMVIVGF